MIHLKGLLILIALLTEDFDDAKPEVVESIDHEFMRTPKDLKVVSHVKDVFNKRMFNPVVSGAAERAIADEFVLAFNPCSTSHWPRQSGD